MKDALVSVREVRKFYVRGSENVHALDGVSLDLYAGEVAALMGPSGSGKSTLLNVIARWEIPDEGTILWRDADLRDVGVLDWAEVGIVPQRLGLLEDLTVDENLELPLLLNGLAEKEASARVNALMNELDIGHLVSRLPIETSLGEQQRVTIGRALALAPAFLLADEPTGNQDHERSTLVMEQFRAAAREGAACLVATHDPAALDLCDRVIELHDGRIVADSRVLAADPFGSPS